MTYLAVRNWKRYQHYTYRQAPWIKLYTALLDDDQIRALPLPTRLLWVQLLLLAGRNANVTRNVPEMIAEEAGIPLRECREGIQQLLKGRWLRETSTARRASKPASRNGPNMLATDLDLDLKQKQKQKPPSVALDAAPVAAAENGTAEKAKERIAELSQPILREL